MANVPISNFTVPANTVGIGASGYSLTGSASASFVDLAGTWNTTGTPTAIKLNITETGIGSPAGSLLMDLQVGGGSRAAIRKDGVVVLPVSASATAPGYSFDGGKAGLGYIGTALRFVGGNNVSWANLGSDYLQIIPSTATIYLGSDLLFGRRATANLRLGAADAAAPLPQTLSVQSASATGADQDGANFTITGSQGRGGGAGGSIIFRVAPAGTPGSGAVNALQTVLQITGAGGLTGQDGTTANTLALRNGANAQTFNIYNTYTDASNYARIALGISGAGGFGITSEAAGTGTVPAIRIRVAGNQNIWFDTASTSRVFIDYNGNLGFGNNVGGDNTYDLGISVYGNNRPRDVGVGRNILQGVGYHQMTEMTAPAAPATNGVRIYAEDNGSGKTRLMALFATGVAQQIAVEP